MKHSEKGFTLTELLIVVALMVIIAGVGGSVITSLVRSYNKANIINQIEQNGNYALSVMENQIRNAQDVSGGGGSLTVKTQDGTDTTFEFTSVAKTCGSNNVNVGVVKKTQGSEVSYLTNEDPVEGIDVVVSESNFTVGSGTPPKVEITLKLQQPLSNLPA